MAGGRGCEQPALLPAALRVSTLPPKPSPGPQPQEQEASVIKQPWWALPLPVLVFFLEFPILFFILVCILALMISTIMPKLSYKDICKFFYSESELSFSVWGTFTG